MDFRKVKRVGNSAHERSCRYHPNNISACIESHHMKQLLPDLPGQHSGPQHRNLSEEILVKYYGHPSRAPRKFYKKSYRSFRRSLTAYIKPLSTFLVAFDFSLAHEQTSFMLIYHLSRFAVGVQVPCLVESQLNIPYLQRGL